MPTPYITLNQQAVKFITIKGQPSRLGLVVEDVTRKGVDGQAHRVNAKRADPVDLKATVDCADFTAVDQLYGKLLDAQGSLVEIGDDYGITFSKQMLLAVKKDAQHALAVGVGGKANQPKAIVTFTLRVQATE